MAWIELHTTLPRHPKTLRLCRELGISLPQAIGHLQLLWLWVLEFAEDGDLTGLAPDEIATITCWEGDPVVLVDALIRCRFLDQHDDAIVVHDWRDYAGRLLADRERKRQARRQSTERPRTIRGTSTDSPRNVRGQSALNQPLTVNQPTGVNPPVSPLAADAAKGGTGEQPALAGSSSSGHEKATKTAARAQPVPAEFVVTEEMRRLAASYGVPAAAIDYETEKFLDHFRAKGERKLDWIAAWRNWMRRAAEMTMHAPARASPNGARASPDRDAAAKAKVEAFLRIARGEE